MGRTERIYCILLPVAFSNLLCVFHDIIMRDMIVDCSSYYSRKCPVSTSFLTVITELVRRFVRGSSL